MLARTALLTAFATSSAGGGAVVVVVEEVVVEVDDVDEDDVDEDDDEVTAGWSVSGTAAGTLAAAVEVVEVVALGGPD